ncbi:MAG: hypothetical protein SGJ27_28235 [Candidatus Melainabacteria bacterium]|nr:hypothetical protein [Candidatus Melainabacteria bacterium]
MNHRIQEESLSLSIDFSSFFLLLLDFFEAREIARSAASLLRYELPDIFTMISDNGFCRLASDRFAA